MPRVNTATKSTAGKEINCGQCSAKIEPGQMYFYWTFRFGGKRVRCAKHPPRGSDLTQSKMSGAYSAIESVEDTIADARKGKATKEDIADQMESSADEIESVRDEYQESLDNMPENFQQGSTGEEIQEKIYGLEEFAESLRSAADEVREAEAEKDSTELDVAIEKAEEALQEFSL